MGFLWAIASGIRESGEDGFALFYKKVGLGRYE